MNCPACGYRRAEGSECPQCGIVFSRYQSEAKDARSAKTSGSDARPPRFSPIRRFYRVFRWVVLAGLILVVCLLLRTSPPPQIEAAQEAAKQAEIKISEFRAILGRGESQVLVINEAELNGWLQTNLATQKSGSGNAGSYNTPETAPDQDVFADEAAVEQVPSSVRDIKIELMEDTLCVYAQFELHGMDLSLELEGRPVVQNGYLRLEPIRGKLGSLPLLAGMLKSATDRLFDSAQNREKFRLPADIKDVRVERGQLVVVSR